jgi:hypothetical protein
VRLAKVTAAIKHGHGVYSGSIECGIERLWRTVKEDCFFDKTVACVESPPPDGAHSAENLKVSILAHLPSIFSHIILTFEKFCLRGSPK